MAQNDSTAGDFLPWRGSSDGRLGWACRCTRSLLFLPRMPPLLEPPGAKPKRGRGKSRYGGSAAFSFMSLFFSLKQSRVSADDPVFFFFFQFFFLIITYKSTWCEQFYSEEVVFLWVSRLSGFAVIASGRVHGFWMSYVQFFFFFNLLQMQKYLQICFPYFISCHLS